MDDQKQARARLELRNQRAQCTDSDAHGSEDSAGCHCLDGSRRPHSAQPAASVTSADRARDCVAARICQSFGRMRIPDSLASLADYGIIEEVVRPLMSGKEAQIYLVSLGRRAARRQGLQGGAEPHASRTARSTPRVARCATAATSAPWTRRSRHGRAQDEAAWRTTEVDMIYRLRDAGVRVPTPYHFIDGVLVMELVTDERGRSRAAPRRRGARAARGAQRVFDRLLARGRAHAVRRRGARRSVRLQRADGRRRARDHRLSAGGRRRRATRTRASSCCATWTTCIASWRASRPSAGPCPTPKRCGRSTSAASSPGHEADRARQASERKVNTEAVLGLIGDATRDERRRRESQGLRMRGGPELPSTLQAPDRSDTAQGRSGHAAARTARRPSLGAEVPRRSGRPERPRPREEARQHATRRTAGHPASHNVPAADRAPRPQHAGSHNAPAADRAPRHATCRVAQRARNERPPRPQPGSTTRRQPAAHRARNSSEAAATPPGAHSRPSACHARPHGRSRQPQNAADVAAGASRAPRPQDAHLVGLGHAAPAPIYAEQRVSRTAERTSGASGAVLRAETSHDLGHPCRSRTWQSSRRCRRRRRASWPPWSGSRRAATSLASPSTFTFANSGKVTSYLWSRRSGCRPRSQAPGRRSRCRESRAPRSRLPCTRDTATRAPLYWGVSPHFEATLTTSRTLPR